MSKRLKSLDGIRGVLMLNAMLFHLCWDLAYIYNKKMPWYTGRSGHIWQQFICCGFILLSGICWRLSDNTGTHLKNGLKIFLFGAVISLVTHIFSYDSRILFGILTLLGSSMLILIPADKILKKIPPIPGAVVFLALFIAFKSVNSGTLLFGLVKLPEKIYSGYFMTYLGFAPPDFYSADYFSLLPWFFLYITGYCLSPLVKSADHRLTDIKIPFFDFIGRYSIVFYLAHQPLFYFGLSILL